MALTPDDIGEYRFRRAVYGYQVSQVDDLLDRLADQIEANEEQLDELRSRLRDTEARLASALETESTLKRTLVTAQQAAERSLEDAREQADELRTAAEHEITQQLEDARREAERVRAEGAAAREGQLARLAQLKGLEERYRTLLRDHLEEHRRVLDELDAQPGLPADLVDELESSDDEPADQLAASPAAVRSAPPAEVAPPDVDDEAGEVDALAQGAPSPAGGDDRDDGDAPEGGEGDGADPGAQTTDEDGWTDGEPSRRSAGAARSGLGARRSRLTVRVREEVGEGFDRPRPDDVP